MSHQASPIGSVEFIVKFETMQGSFIKAMKEAMKNADINIEGNEADSAKIDEILYNIRYRLRTPFSGDFEQFRAAAIPEIEFAKSEKAAHDFASALRSKNMVIKKPEESTEDYIERSQDAAKVLYDHWTKMIEESIKDPSFFRKNQNKLVNLQGAIQQAMSGSWEYMVRTFVEQVLTETEVEEAMRKRLEEYGLSAQGNKRKWSRVETSVQRPGATRQLKSERDLMQALSRTDLTKEQIKEVLEWDPREWKKMPPEMKDEVNKILNDYWVKAWDVQIPNTILHIWKDYLKDSDWFGEEFKMAKELGKIHDVINIIEKGQLKNLKKFLEDFDVPEDQVEKMMGQVSGQLKEFGGWAFLPWEGKIAGAMAKWFKKRLAGYDETMMMTFHALGKTGGVGGISSTKLLEKVEGMSKEDLKQFILEQRQEQRSNYIIDMLNQIKGDTKAIGFLEEKLDIIKEDPSKTLGTG